MRSEGTGYRAGPSELCAEKKGSRMRGSDAIVAPTIHVAGARETRRKIE